MLSFHGFLQAHVPVFADGKLLAVLQDGFVAVNGVDIVGVDDVAFLNPPEKWGQLGFVGGENAGGLKVTGFRHDDGVLAVGFDVENLCWEQIAVTAISVPEGDFVGVGV